MSTEAVDATGLPGEPGLRIRLLGPVAIIRDGSPLRLPPSRKVRALLAVLAMSASPASRSRLCDLLWEVPNDPRGELRWCLSKLRGLLDDGDRRRVVTSERDLIALDLSDCFVDTREIERIASAGVARATDEQLTAACESFGGDLLDGLELDGSPRFSGWLTAQRHRYRALHVSLLEELSRRTSGSDETFAHLKAWLALSPFDQRAHMVMLDALLKRGRLRDAEEHAGAALAAFRKEGLDVAPLRDAWLARRAAQAPSADSPGSAITAASVTTVTALPATAAIAPNEARAESPARRASVAVMSFAGRDAEPADRRLGDGVAEDVILRLAKLRSLFVIARGSTFALGERGLGALEAGRALRVQYVVSGSVRRRRDRISIVVELAEVPDGRIVWTDEFGGGSEDAFALLGAIVDQIAAGIAEEIEAEECRRAIVKMPSSLTAWETYHRGLWHMYRFNGPDNERAAHFFEAALELDPSFSRAHAGLSFTHFQNAFLGLTGDRARQIDLALETSARSLRADDRDPAAHWAAGRALWLRGEDRESLVELSRSVELCPSFALGHYTLGFVQSQTGDPHAAIAATDTSRRLSPFDPLEFAMLASRALALVRLGEIEQAATLAVEAAGRPNAHAHILAVAAQCLSMADRLDEARAVVARLRAGTPGYDIEHFLRAFRFPRDTTERFRNAARRIGLDSG